MEIQKLKSDVIDKIAAGEVVERPAHLLKELIENSIDAGATKIDIDVDNGGKNITVSDNGKGVPYHEIPLVFARHATSKIKDSDDLWKLSTFGFRGEALASIASVCQLDFTSRRKGESKAYRVHCEFGQMGEVVETSAQDGTRVQISQLFSNIPARLKFLKSESAEVTQIKNVIKAMALQHPDVEWKFKHRGELCFYWPISSLLERARKVFEIENLYENTHEYEGFKARVIFADPANVVKVSRQIWIFIQNRWVQDRGLQAAVMEAYHSLLMHGQYPICFVSVECPPDEVDVNIHPTKSQVKFIDSKKAFRVVHYCLRHAIEMAPWIVKSKQEPKLEIDGFVAFNQTFSEPTFQRTQFKTKSFAPMPIRIEPPPGPAIGMAELQMAAAREEFEESEQGAGYWSSLHIVGQVDLTYVVAQAGDKMVLIDQHAAHERVAYEKLMRAWKESNIEVQSFLIPLTVDLSETAIEHLMKATDQLAKVGVVVEQAGPSSLAISSLPSFIREKGLVEALIQMASEIESQGGSFAFEKSIGDLFATMACHSVVRAGQALSIDEMTQLLKDMDEFPLSGFCPHGRNVSLDFPFSKIEKDFGRRG